jgi:ABC-type uncharacterized transport system substrate-binding protein
VATLKGRIEISQRSSLYSGVLSLRSGAPEALEVKRRDFIMLLGGAAATWPLAARAQQSTRMRRIGVLMGLSESDPEAQSRIAAFRKTLQGLGWTEGRNVQADYYWAAGDIDRTHTLAKELVSSAPDVIVVNTPPGLSALRVETHTIPIVFV